jgi:hypothetical protein
MPDDPASSGSYRGQRSTPSFRRAAEGSTVPVHARLPAEMAPPGQTALFNAFEDAQECAKCGGRMVRTGSCYTCRDCGTNTGCS